MALEYFPSLNPEQTPEPFNWFGSVPVFEWFPWFGSERFQTDLIEPEKISGF
jgi:hypothetical protein